MVPSYSVQPGQQPSQTSDSCPARQRRERASTAVLARSGKAVQHAQATIWLWLEGLLKDIRHLRMQGHARWDFRSPCPSVDNAVTSAREISKTSRSPSQHSRACPSSASGKAPGPMWSTSPPRSTRSDLLRWAAYCHVPCACEDKPDWLNPDRP